MVYKSLYYLTTYTAARRTWKTRWTYSTSLMYTSRDYPCVSFSKFSFHFFFLNSTLLLDLYRTLSSSSSLFAARKTRSPFRTSLIGRLDFCFSQLGCHEIAPPTPCVRDALFLRVGLQSRRGRFPGIVAL